MTGYVEPRDIRHRTVFVGGVETLRIPPRRQWFAVAFLPVWLILWTLGGVQAIGQLAEDFSLFLVVWLCLWAVGLVFVVLTLAMQVAGAETVRVIRGDLELSNGIGPFRRTWRYRGAAIRDITAQMPAFSLWGAAHRLDRPFFLRPRTGAVSFSYGAETVYLAAGVDLPEGRAIADWLVRRLPGSAPAR